jgi:hypothetical protein
MLKKEKRDSIREEGRCEKGKNCNIGLISASGSQRKQK